MPLANEHSIFTKNHPRVKRVVVNRRAKPSFRATRRTCEGMTLAPVLIYLLLSFISLHLWKTQLVTQLVFVELVFDVFLNSLCVLSCGVNIVSSAPKFSVSIFIFQLRELFIDHSCTFPFEISHKLRNRNFGRDFYENVDMVRACFCFQKIYSFPFAKLS